MAKLVSQIVSLINDTIIDLGKYQGYCQATTYNSETIIRISNQMVEASEFFDLLKLNKNKNRWLYNEVFENNVEYLI